MNLVTAIQAKQAARLLGFTLTTYANLLLRPQPRRGSKFSPIPLTNYEEDRIFHDLLGSDLRKWRWVVGSEHTRYIYMAYREGTVKITSVSGFYSGQVLNQFNVLEDRGKWLMVETLKARSDWWKNPIPPHLIHSVYTFKGYLPKCGPVRLPVITSTGYGFLERYQVY
jgi:hypothetical protein